MTGSTQKDPLGGQMGKIMDKLKKTIMHSQNPKLSFYIKNASLGHFC